MTHDPLFTDQGSTTHFPSTIPPHQGQRQQPAPSHKPESPWTVFSVNLLDVGDSLVYVIVGVCFFAGSLFALGYSFWDFYSLINNNFNPEAVAGAIIQFVSDLLLVLIIMEVLGTITHYLKEQATSLRPFLFIGIISATRGILSIGAKLSIKATNVPTDEFNKSMIELAVNGAVILALGITIKLLGKHVDDNS